MKLLRWLILLLLCPGALLAQKPNACALLTRSEIEQVQGEKVIDAKGSEAGVGGLRLRRCYYELANADKSISLELTRKDPTSSGPGPRQRWRDLFHATEEERERREPREQEEKAPPLKVTGIGEEAFWMGRGGLGALYVLKNDAYLRISIGGAEERASKIQKAKALARKALKRF